MDSASVILLIEDDPSAQAFLQTALGQAGYRTVVAGSAKEGLIEAWRNLPALIIVDVMLPDMSGIEVIRRLRADQRSAKARILIFSARSDLKEMLEGRRAGADEYIVKRPGADAELLQRVRALVPLAAADIAAGRPAGRLISFLSAKGGTGTSSITVNLAQNLAALVAPKRVAVVDLVLPLGSISQIVGAASPGTVVEASLLPPGRLSPQLIEKMLTFVPAWQFHLFSGPPEPRAAQQLQVEGLEPMFSMLRQAFDYVLVDSGRDLSRVGLPFIARSAAAVLVLSSDVATVALTKITLQYLETQGVLRQQIFPVLNRAVGLEGMSRAEMERELGLPICAMVPHIDGGFSQANNLHLPIATKFPEDTACLVFRDMAVNLLSRVEETAQRADASSAVMRRQL